MYSAASFVALREEPAELRAELCRKFFNEIYRDAFPNPDETEGPHTWLPLMSNNVPPGQPLVHIILALDTGGQILGGVIFEFYRESKCWLVTYIAVRPEVRHRGIGEALITTAVETISRRTGDVTLFAETEIPARLATRPGRDWAWTRLAILTSFGLRRIPIDYVQPALSPEKHPIDNLYLLLYVGKSGRNAIASVRLISFLREFYAALHQPSSPYLGKMCNALAKRPILETQRLLTFRQDENRNSNLKGP
jgi:GNAT superfamily N-acetyltransferase